jgi:hypothetical protein
MKSFQFAAVCFIAVIMFVIGHFTSTWEADLRWAIPCIIGIAGSVAFIMGAVDPDV